MYRFKSSGSPQEDKVKEYHDQNHQSETAEKQI